MKSLLLSIFLVVVVSAVEKEFYDLSKAPELYIKYMRDYNRKYENNYDLLIHYEAFRTSLININNGNSDPTSIAVFGLNDLADLTTEDMKKRMGYKPLVTPNQPIVRYF